MEGSVSPAPQQPETSQTPEVPVEALETIELMQEEVDEARKLAEEWEIKYKEMQRQMADLDMARRTNMDKKVNHQNEMNTTGWPICSRTWVGLT